ncbi:iron-siderophore ABC transporter substrate-binding protein [Fusibacter bizertensis]
MKYKKKIGFILLAVLMLVIVGCSNDSTVKTDETISTTEGATSSESTEGIEAKNTASQFPMIYTDVAGRSIEIKSQPQKIAVSYLPHWETLILLDAMPIATTNAEHYAKTWDPFENLDLSKVIDLGATEVNLELLSSLQPDLILEQTMDVNNIDIVNLEKIAPVVVFSNEVKMDWRFSLREIGKVIGKSDKAEEVITEVEAKISAARAQITERYKDKTVMLMSLMGEDRYFIAHRDDLYNAETGLGLKAPEGFTTSTVYEQISIEGIVNLNPDYLFVNVFDGDEAILEALKQNPVWQSLNASKEGHIYRLDGSGHAASAMSTVHTLDKIIEIMLGE